MALVPVDHGILVEAEAIAPHVRTLDAIRLATALRSGIEGVVVASHDARMLSAARELAFTGFDPCEGEWRARSSLGPRACRPRLEPFLHDVEVRRLRPGVVVVVG
ncbi:hypothetical protein [Microbacterium karelineae]|uniref:hypothetical protein n=1 Tax=Microbacterium karelineae TaxID=2654283 RepID=UPI0034D32181